jgi:hypothetical protein
MVPLPSVPAFPRTGVRPFRNSALESRRRFLHSFQSPVYSSRGAEDETQPRRGAKLLRQHYPVPTSEENNGASPVCPRIVSPAPRPKSSSLPSSAISSTSASSIILRRRSAKAAFCRFSSFLPSSVQQRSVTFWRKWSRPKIMKCAHRNLSSDASPFRLS